MNVREISQIEIWSKETSRKIFVVFGIVIGLCCVGYGVWYEIEIHWLTRGERDAARVALQQIETLRGANSLSDQEYLDRSKQVQTKLDPADRAAKTYLDQLTQMRLGMCLVGVEDERFRMIVQHSLERRRLPLYSNADRDYDAKADALMSELARESCSALHKALD
jgi:hypothetical protein